jgi:SAM-dependent methyltransferase
VKTFLDAPCGEFHWMQAVKTPPGMRYVGGDIVPALVADTKARFGGGARDFIHLDITKGPLPAADLWMCRDCLFHLSYADIARALQQFAKADIPLLLLTTHIVPRDQAFANRDINTGDARPIDLRADPFDFPEPLERFDDWVAPFSPREMGLWSREQVLPVAERMAARFLA